MRGLQEAGGLRPGFYNAAIFACGPECEPLAGPNWALLAWSAPLAALALGSAATGQDQSARWLEW